MNDFFRLAVTILALAGASSCARPADERAPRQRGQTLLGTPLCEPDWTPETRARLEEGELDSLRQGRHGILTAASEYS